MHERKTKVETGGGPLPLTDMKKPARLIYRRAGESLKARIDNAVLVDTHSPGDYVGTLLRTNERAVVWFSSGSEGTEQLHYHHSRMGPFVVHAGPNKYEVVIRQARTDAEYRTFSDLLFGAFRNLLQGRVTDSQLDQLRGAGDAYLRPSIEWNWEALNGQIGPDEHSCIDDCASRCIEVLDSGRELTVGVFLNAMMETLLREQGKNDARICVPAE